MCALSLASLFEQVRTAAGDFELKMVKETYKVDISLPREDRTIKSLLRSIAVPRCSMNTYLISLSSPLGIALSCGCQCIWQNTHDAIVFRLHPHRLAYPCPQRRLAIVQLDQLVEVIRHISVLGR